MKRRTEPAARESGLVRLRKPQNRSAISETSP